MSEEEGKKSVTVEANVAKAIATPITATAMVGFSPQKIEERLENDEYSLAIVSCTTKLESILSYAIRDHYKWSEEKFEEEGYLDRGLGFYIQECIEYGVLPNYDKKLKELQNDHIITIRNRLVHEHGFLEDVEENEELKNDIRDKIKESIELIEDIEI